MMQLTLAKTQSGQKAIIATWCPGTARSVAGLLLVSAEQRAD